MRRLMTFFWFDKDAEAAVRFYTSLVPESRIDRIDPMPAETPSGPAGSVRVFEFTLMGQPYQAIEAGPLHPFNTAISLMVECETQEEIDRLWSAILSEGGQEIECGWIQDRWGLRWQIVPYRLAELMRDSDAARAKRAQEAMLKMKKLDIAALEAA